MPSHAELVSPQGPLDAPSVNGRQASPDTAGAHVEQLAPRAVCGPPPSAETNACADVNADASLCPLNIDTTVTHPSFRRAQLMCPPIVGNFFDTPPHVDDSVNSRLSHSAIPPLSPDLASESPDTLIQADYREHSGSYHRDGLSAYARYNHPRGVCFRAHDSGIYVADFSNHCVRRVDQRTGMVTTIAGFSHCPGHRDGAAADAKFNHPCSISAASDGSLYVCDFASHTIRRISADLSHVSTVAGAADDAGFVDGKATESRFRHPVGVVVAASSGYIFISDYNHVIRRLCLRTHSVDTIAGNGKPGFAVNNAVGEDAQFYYPHGLAWDDAFDRGRGALYVADSCNQCVRQLIFQEGAGYYEVRVIAGSGFSGYADGPALEARFEAPVALACTSDGSLFIVDEVNCNVRLLVRLPTLLPQEIGDAQGESLVNEFRWFVSTVSQDVAVFLDNLENPINSRCDTVVGGGLAIVPGNIGLLMTDFLGNCLLRYDSVIRHRFVNYVTGAQQLQATSDDYFFLDLNANLNRQPRFDADNFSIAGHSDSTCDWVDDLSDDASDDASEWLMVDTNDELFEEEKEQPRSAFREDWNAAKIELLEREVDFLRSRFAMMKDEMELLKQDNRELKRVIENKAL